MSKGKGFGMEEERVSFCLAGRPPSAMTPSFSRRAPTALGVRAGGVRMHESSPRRLVALDCALHSSLTELIRFRSLSSDQHVYPSVGLQGGSTSRRGGVAFSRAVLNDRATRPVDLIPPTRPAMARIRHAARSSHCTRLPR